MKEKELREMKKVNKDLRFFIFFIWGMKIIKPLILKLRMYYIGIFFSNIYITLNCWQTNDKTVVLYVSQR